jgi:predicted methyltransferase
MRGAPLLALPLALAALAGCGSHAASVPCYLDLPVPPAAKPAAARRAPTTEPAAAVVVKGPDPVRPGAKPVPVPPGIQKVVDAADRDGDDKKLDGGRHAGELLAFLALRPGARVAELVAGGGYTTELLARDVGPGGHVWGENNAFILKFADKPWGERLKRPAMKNVTRVDRELDAPLPPDARNLDAVVMVLNYHDTVWLGTDRDKMNKAVFDALRRGGEYVIVDHSAPEGTGTQDVKTTHRIDELFVVREVEHAGFQLAGYGDFLRNPGDKRDWNASPREAGERRGQSDRFVLKFVKP